MCQQQRIIGFTIRGVQVQCRPKAQNIHRFYTCHIKTLLTWYHWDKLVILPRWTTYGVISNLIHLHGFFSIYLASVLVLFNALITLISCQTITPSNLTTLLLLPVHLYEVNITMYIWFESVELSLFNVHTWNEEQNGPRVHHNVLVCVVLQLQPQKSCFVLKKPNE